MYLLGIRFIERCQKLKVLKPLVLVYGTSTIRDVRITSVDLMSTGDVTLGITR